MSIDEPDKLSREEWLRSHLRATQKDLIGARKKKQFTAISVLGRQCRDTRNELDAHLAALAVEADDPLTEMSDEELIAIQCDILEDMPLHLIEPIAEVVVRRFGGPAIERIGRGAITLGVDIDDEN